MFPNLTTWDKGRWPNFSREEFACEGSGECRMDPAFLDLLQRLRAAFGPLAIASGFRSPAHNAKVSSTGLDGPHTSGQACDVTVFGERARLLTHHALQLGFTGIGWKQHGPQAGRFVHLDMIQPGGKHPRPWIWTYP